jgi:hypothetical protein
MDERIVILLEEIAFRLSHCIKEKDVYLKELYASASLYRLQDYSSKTKQSMQDPLPSESLPKKENSPGKISIPNRSSRKN